MSKAQGGGGGGSSERGGFVLGLIVGLLIGLAVALGVALYINKTPIPFVNKVPQRTAEQDAEEAARNKNWDPNAPLAGKNPARPASAAASGAVAGAEPAASAPVAAAVPTPAPVAAAPSAPASGPRSSRDPAAILAGQAGALPPKSTAPGPEAFMFYVQAGAYARTEDAETQRAKLAMLGITAKVMEREQAGRLVYRVRVGPFDARDEAESMQTRLAGSGVESNLVRVER